MITIIVPIHNTEKYLDKCLNSIRKQTYKDIEVLCIDSSNDSSTEIVRKFVNKDKRFKLIVDKNNSYGYKINLGISKANGSYIGVVDSDDYIKTKMYERAYEAIKKYRLDFVKFDYMSFFEESKTKNIYMSCGCDDSLYNKNFNSKQKPNVFYDSNIAIWSGLYRKKFLVDNKILLNESKGASFQDTGFFVFTHLYAKRIRYINESYYIYRRNSLDSSSLANKNVYSVISEFAFILNKIEKDRNINKEQYNAILCRKIFTYSWNYLRLDKSYAEKFEKRARKELKEIYNNDIYNQFPSRIKNYIDNTNVLKNIK